jgi:N4-(beta-N-acetylglucosaminyl)-L-asparaginase
LDALIMDGMTFDAGSVSYIRSFRNAISIARGVMTYTSHTLLTGEGAEEFADILGFERKSATTDTTKKDYAAWIENKCQPNFYENIEAAKSECGPYNITSQSRESAQHHDKLFAADSSNHDTIGIVTLDANGNMACGTSTNGANHKVAGRVGDSPIIGAGCYVNGITGYGAAATGDGDVMMRFSPSFYAVTLMETGSTPTAACSAALNRIAKVFPTFSGGMVCISADGTHGGAANNMSFQYSLYMDGMDAVAIVDVA